MRGAAGRVVAIGTLAACLLIGGPASAQAPAMRLDYETPEGCPDADAFTAELRARAPQSSTYGSRSIHVRIVANAASSRVKGLEGSVTITDDSGATPSREVRGDSCAEVVRALALAVAMTFDPADVVPPAVVITNEPPRNPAPETGAPPPTAPDRLHLSVGLKGGAESAVGPLLAPAFGIYAELAAGSLSLRLGAVRAVSPLVQRASGSTRFARTAATLDGCPFRWRATPTLSAVPCIAFEFGSLSSEGRSTTNPESTSRLWLATGLSGRVVWEPVGPLVLELEGRANVPLTRDSFFFRPAEDVFEAPIVAFSAGLAAGVRFR